MISPFFRTVARVELFFFSVWTFLPNYVYAFKIYKETNKRKAVLEIPSEYGELVEQSGQYPRVVIIQTIHSNYEVQKRIVKILEYLDKRWKFDAIGVEGAYGKIDTSLLSSVPDIESNNIKEKTIDFFLIVLKWPFPLVIKRHRISKFPQFRRKNLLFKFGKNISHIIKSWNHLAP